jgi:DNA-binding response OmpR family regulator
MTDQTAARAGAARLLLVEDESTLAGAIAYRLAREGYAVETAADGAAALRRFREQQPDLVLLDLMLPVMDGWEVCRAIRRDSSVPILMLTARAEETDKVLGLELGADDYVVKPFGMHELIARVRALLRRAGVDRDHVIMQEILIGPLRIRPDERRVFRDDTPIDLRRREFDLLAFLARNAGQVFSRDSLLERVWGYDFEGEARTVDVHIRMLREKIERDPSNPALLQTIRNVGYTLRG